MQRLHRFRAFVALLLALLALPLYAEPAPDPAGHWEGLIALPTIPLPIRIDLERKEDGWTGTIDIPAQGVRAFQLQPVMLDGTTVRFAMPKIPGDPSFSGEWDKAAATISGEFSQNGLKFPFKLDRRERPAPAAGETPAIGLPGEGIAGHWQGDLRLNVATALRVALEITKTPTGVYAGSMISLDQDPTPIPIASLTETTDTVVLKVPNIGGAFDGKLNANGSELAGEWQQNGGKLPVTFKRLASPASTRRSQEPTKPFPYTEEEVAVKNAAAGITLAGTLNLPPGKGPHPAVVLLTGSGPQDRNEAIMGHRPFLVLADRLTRAGIAVLRCDDRGVAKSTGDFGKAVPADFVADALSAVAFLKTRSDIDSKHIGLLGHSEGGIVAPSAAVQNPADIAFIVLLAGVGVPMEELLYRQAADMGRVMGASEETVAKNVAAQREIFAKVKGLEDDAAAEKAALEVIQRHVQEIPAEQRSALGLTDAMISAQSKLAASPWFRKLLVYDPRPTLRQVKCPVLAINGTKDLQVASKENLAGIREALAAGGNTRVKIVEFPGLNHLFQTCTTGSIAEYSQIDETIAPAVLQTISTWIQEQTAQ